MLNIFRKNTKLVIWIIVLSFIIWGGGAAMTTSDLFSPNAGSVFNKKVKIRDFEKQKKLLKLLLPIEHSTLPDEFLNAETFKQIALYTKAKNEGMKISDKEVRMTIESLIGPSNVLDMRSYTRWTKSVLGENPRDFEEALRNQLLAQKYLAKLLKEAGYPITPPEGKISKKEQKEIEEENNNLQMEVTKDFLVSADIQINLRQ